MQRYSSRRQGLDLQFINPKLQGAVSYDRIAGFFRSSILEVAGEALEKLEGTIRVVCNSDLSVQDVETAKAAQQAIRRSWCAGEPEKSPQLSHPRFARLFEFLTQGKMQVRVLPDEVFGLIHGKAGVITYTDGSKTSFLGSANESKTAWKLNYELVWEDDSPDTIAWVQEEFNALWNHPHAVPLADFVIQDINRIAHRVVIDRQQWLEEAQPNPASAVVETPMYRQELGLWAHQKFFIKKAFEDHLKGSARYILADQVGLGKTVQLAISGLLMALHGNKPVLVIAPKPLVLQWQGELKDLIGIPSAIWDGRQWIDEQGLEYPSKGAESIRNCPRRIGIISQGLITSGSEIVDFLKAMKFECIIVDEAHRARRKKISDNSPNEPADPNNLMRFLLEVSDRTKSMILATATPVQLHPIEAWDMLNVLGVGSQQVLGNEWSNWRKPAEVIPIVMGEKTIPEDIYEAWSWLRNPLPPASEDRSFRNIRRRLGIKDDDYVAPGDSIKKLTLPDITKVNKVLYDYGRQHNPFIRHIVRRTRAYLETKIDDSIGEPYLKPVRVKLFGESSNESLVLPFYCRQAYQHAEEFCELLGQRVRSAGLYKTLLLRRIGSTMASGQKTIENLLKKNEQETENRSTFWDEEDEELEDNVNNSEFRNLSGAEIELLRQCRQLLEDNQEKDPKYREVKHYLLEKGWLELGCIIFSQYYDSVMWLAMQLSAEDLRDEKIGIYSGEARSGIIEQGLFKRLARDEIKQMVRRGELRLIIGTDAASEGLNLQRLGTLINLDLPWNPTRLEQRKGRIQRIGQIRDEIFILNLRYRDSVEDRVHELLSSRLEEIHGLFGQIPDVLEDVWVNLAVGEEEQAKKLIQNIKPAHPFDERYSQIENIEWESCSNILNEAEKLSVLRKGW
ncbi:MAG TPA: phospholipase D-like domain-containing anti-phage protein [Coleofasciculaceae cyanobacterium]|jgi:superfamily II DNA or RNA helicase